MATGIGHVQHHTGEDTGSDAAKRHPKGEIPFPGPSWLVSQAVKTPPFHGGNAGSIPARATKATKEGTKIQQGASPYEETAWPNKLQWME